jgi:hypothetical protein
MSGQLVGEVIDALEMGLRLTTAERLALLAITEKCHADTRQGSVRLDRIIVAVGASKRTTERALASLRKRGIIWVVARGYKAPGGKLHAPIYQVAKLPPIMVAEATGVSFRQIDVELPPNRRRASAKSAQASATRVPLTWGASTIDGSIDGEVSTDGLNDGARALRARAAHASEIDFEAERARAQTALHDAYPEQFGIYPETAADAAEPGRRKA